MKEEEKNNRLRKETTIIDSLNCAIEGIINVIKTEKNMKIHFYITIIVLLATLFLNLQKIEVALIFIAITIVWVAEIINTAIENVVDMYMKDYHELAKLAKDAGAGAVFVAAVNSVIIGYLVTYSHFEKGMISVFKKIKGSDVHTSVISLILVVIVVLGLKAHLKRGTPLSGGMPSGHTALAFSVWISILFITENIYVIVASLFMALLVAQTRVKTGIHTVKEVVAGALVGIIVTLGVILIVKKF